MITPEHMKIHATDKFIFGSTFVELILDRIDFIGINLIRIDFEINWFIFGSFVKNDFNKK